jgi:hypothetical protein
MGLLDISKTLNRPINGTNDRWKNYLKKLDKKSLEYIKTMSEK